MFGQVHKGQVHKGKCHFKWHVLPNNRCRSSNYQPVIRATMNRKLRKNFLIERTMVSGKRKLSIKEKTDAKAMLSRNYF